MPASSSRLTPSHLVALLLSAGAYLGLAYAMPRTHFGWLTLLVGVAVGAYSWLLHTRLPLRWGLGAALVLRLLWLPATPALSDDFYRFRWDGLLSSHSINPFRFRPNELSADSTLTPTSLQKELRQLYPRLNSPRYFSVYPSVCQLAFWAGAKLFPASLMGFVVWLRLIILLAEIGSAALLLRLLPAICRPGRQALVYLLHPLVIVELTGNLHFEAVVIFFLLLTGALLASQRALTAGAAFALAVATKLLPLLALPLLVLRLSWRQVGWFGGALLGSLGLLFAPFVSWPLLLNISRSLNLYFQNFEFNASLFYLLRAEEFWRIGYDQIHRLGPALAAVAAVVVLGLAAGERRPTLTTLPLVALLAFSAYFLCATVVHPWYLTPLVALSCLTRLRFPIVWAALAFLSYSAYQTAVYAEHLELVALEYLGTLAVAVWDVRRILANRSLTR